MIGAAKSGPGCRPLRTAFYLLSLFLISFSLLAPITALGVGRLVLGVSADAAALRAGLVGVRTFARRDDLLLLLFLLPPVLSFGAIMWPAPIVESVPR